MIKFSTLLNFFNDHKKSVEVEALFSSEDFLSSLSEEYSPRKRTLENILSFSRSYTTIPSKMMNFVDINLN